MVLVDRATSAHNLAKLLERIVKVLVGPVLAKSFDKDIAVLLTAPVHFLIEGKRTADFSVDLRVLDFFSELASVKVVGKSCVSVVKVLKLGSGRVQ